MRTRTIVAALALFASFAAQDSPKFELPWTRALEFVIGSGDRKGLTRIGTLWKMRCAPFLPSPVTM